MNDTDVRKYVIQTCNGLKEVEEHLKGAAENVENHTTRERIEAQLSSVQECLKGCEGIAKSLL